MNPEMFPSVMLQRAPYVDDSADLNKADASQAELIRNDLTFHNCILPYCIDMVNKLAHARHPLDEFHPARVLSLFNDAGGGVWPYDPITFLHHHKFNKLVLADQKSLFIQPQAGDGENAKKDPRVANRDILFAMYTNDKQLIGYVMQALGGNITMYKSRVAAIFTYHAGDSTSWLRPDKGFPEYLYHTFPYPKFLSRENANYYRADEMRVTFGDLRRTLNERDIRVSFENKKTRDKEIIKEFIIPFRGDRAFHTQTMIMSIAKDPIKTLTFIHAWELDDEDFKEKEKIEADKAKRLQGDFDGDEEDGDIHEIGEEDEFGSTDSSEAAESSAEDDVEDEDDDGDE
jgi:hypothetical protein